MKKFISAAIAASMIASPAMAASAQQHTPGKSRAPQYQVQPKQPQKQAVRYGYSKPSPIQFRNDWRKGERFDGRYARNYAKINHKQYRGLKAPPRGYHYVRSGNDAVLVGITSGIIAAVFANMIR